MNNFRPHQPKNSFDGRAQQGSDLTNSWITDDEIISMRRQNTHFHPLVSNMMPNMQSSLLNQSHHLPTPNKNYGNQSSCKMTSSNFMHSPNPSNMKHSVNEQNFPNRFVGDRFSNTNSFSNVNTQYKINEGPLFKEFPGSSTMSPHSRKNESFPDISKQLFSNMRPSERFSCMQNDQTSFHQKYDSPQTFQGKSFQFTNDKAFLSPNTLPYCEKPPSSLASSFTSKPTYRAPSLFPAYSPKDAIPVESGSKVVQETAYSSDFTEKSSSFCDETPVSSSFIKTTQSFQERTLQDGSLENALNELFQNNSSFFDKPSFKEISNSEELNDSFKAPMEAVTCSNDKFPFTSDNQQSCFQTSSDVTFQKSQSLQFSSHSNSASSKDCLMQSTAFTAETNVHQSLKESIPALSCSFNFESNISSADIADLLPGIDAFLKETSTKSEVVLPKTNVSKANSAFSTDLNAWSKPSIPFIGDTQTSHKNDLNVPEIDTYCSDTSSWKKGYNDKPESRSEKISDGKPSVIHQENKLSVVENQQKNDVIEEKLPKINSTLEEAIDMLVTKDAIVGLDYIIEYKKTINQKGSFPFKCKLCNSAISRTNIIDHIIGSKHRMKYLKAKDEAKFKSIISQNSEESERETIITEIAFQLEKIFGRGHVTVESEVFQKDSVTSENPVSEDTNTDPPVVFTLDKIPIGFEALSPQHDDVHSTTFSLGSDLSHENLDTLNSLQKVDEAATSVVEIKKEAQMELSSEYGFTLPGLGHEFSENDVPDSSSLISDGVNVDSSKNSDLSKEHASVSTQPSSLPSIPAKVKRSASPDPFFQFKQQKVSDASNSENCPADNVTDPASPKIKTENSPSREKSFTSDLLEELSKCVISSEEEASFALQAVNILIQMLLRYKLQHISLEVVENMMRSLQSRSPDKIEELMSLLKDSKMFEDEEDPQKASVLKSEPLQPKCEENMDQTLPSHAESINLDFEPTLGTKNVLDSFGAALSLSSGSSSTSAVSNTMCPVSAAPTASVGNVMNVHSNVVSSVSLEPVIGLQPTSAMNSQTTSSAGLKPPPFFNWPQTSETATNPGSYTVVQGNQNMMWTSPYQHSQTQFAQMPFYQAQGYANTFTGNQTYQSQYSVLPQGSVPLKMVNPPPLPPPPPPPPPAPNNPPLPPLPKSAGFPAAASHSISLTSNPLSCLSSFSNPPPPPPPPLP